MCETVAETSGFVSHCQPAGQFIFLWTVDGSIVCRQHVIGTMTVDAGNELFSARESA